VKKVSLSDFKFLTVRDVVKNNAKKILDKSKNCRVFKIKYTVTNRSTIILMVKCRESYSDKGGHLVHLKVKPSYLKNPNKAILLAPMKYFCTCPAFLYWGSLYNASKDKYLIRGQKEETRKPDIRDPERENLVCKHISAVAPYFKQQTVKKAMRGAKKVRKVRHDDLEIEDIPYASWEEILDSMEKIGISRDIVTSDNFEELLVSKFDLSV
jgi:hypothetical protein